MNTQHFHKGDRVMTLTSSRASWETGVVLSVYDDGYLKVTLDPPEPGHSLMNTTTISGYSDKFVYVPSEWE
jgi:hypothetical protein